MGKRSASVFHQTLPKCPAEARSALLLVAFSVSDLFVSPSFSECIVWKSGRSLGWGYRLVFWSVLQHVLLSDPRRKTEEVS